MRRDPLPTVLAGLVLKFVIDRIPGPRRQQGGVAGARRRPRPAPGRPKGRLATLVLVSLALTLVLMIVFHEPITRVFGVLAMFTFIVSGVFLIADPSFLSAEEED